MRAPRKAFVLAAGYGTRLRPLTLETPKPMLPLWNRPMLARTLDMLADWDVREVLINLHHAPGPIMRFLATQPVPNLKICAVFEPDILGTGGALRNARWFLDQPFWLLNADILARLDPAPLLQVWQRDHPLAACWLTEDAGPLTVRCVNGIIRSFHDPENGHATFCGLQLLDPRILPYIAPEGFDTIIAAYQRAQKQGKRIAGITIPGAFWADIGTPAQYLQAHHDTAKMLGHAGQTVILPAAAIFTPAQQRALHRLQPLPPHTPLDVLPLRGSQREFFRLPPPPHPSDSPASAIVIRWSPERRENRLYARHTRFLERLGLPVPRLLLDAPRARLLAIEDLGPETLETRLPTLTPAQILATYRQLLDISLKLHTDALPAARQARLPLMPGFGPALYRFEHDYFIQNILRDRLQTSQKQMDAIAAELQTISRLLADSPQGLIHRDWQSSNILFRDRQPVMIDYQGMRRGPVAYDLASLLCDPYADLPADQQTRLLRHYARRHPDGDRLIHVFPAAAIQRLAQALGAYAVLSRKPGMETFTRYIPPAARQMLRALHAHPLPALADAISQLALADTR